jgi:isoleucyl-tRNA synthetase
VTALVAKYPPMSADVMRWMYCRNNPTQPIHFGPESADEVRSRFVMKLWNVYSFFCNYARLDGFDPSRPEVPISERSDLDRWILSDLQKLIRTARSAFDEFNVMAFCLEAERFVDDKLSNWYVRRSRRRFWKGEQGPDKDAAYQTLYATLTTLARLIAPIVPFLAESLYQNLVVKGHPGKNPVSVHLTDYPVPDESLIDEQLSADMNALLNLVSLGSAARNAVKIKVRQPLAELRVQTTSEAARRAVERFKEQIAEELNLKRVTLQEADLLLVEVKPNPRTLGPKFGARLHGVESAIRSANPRELAAKVQKGEPFELSAGGETFLLDPADVVVSLKAEEGWSGVADRDTQMALDARITEELALEGLARDVVRNIQDLRKKANLEMEDRIELSLTTMSAKLRNALETHREYIASETLVRTWSPGPLEGDYAVAQATIDGQSLEIRLRKC